MPDKPDWKTPVRYEKYDDGSEAIWDADGTLIYSIPAIHTIDLRMLCILGRRDLEGVANCVNKHDRLSALAALVEAEDGTDGILMKAIKKASEDLFKAGYDIAEYDNLRAQVQGFRRAVEHSEKGAKPAQTTEERDDATTDTD